MCSDTCQTCIEGGGGSGCINDGRCTGCGAPSPSPGPTPTPTPPTPPPSPTGCSSKSSITASELQRTFPQLSSGKASTYASGLSSHLQGTLSNKCHWAAYLGNVGTESSGLTQWTEIGCLSTYPDGFCGRGPLQITGKSNYAYCASASDCSDCSGIVSDPTIVSSNTFVGFETSRCVWHSLSGQSLSGFADGTLSGLRATACYINAGHSPCSTLNGWASRQAYWKAANTCLGVTEEAANETVV